MARPIFAGLWAQMTTIRGRTVRWTGLPTSIVANYIIMTTRAIYGNDF